MKEARPPILTRDTPSCDIYAYQIHNIQYLKGYKSYRVNNVSLVQEY